jgi:hypothetical protein
MPDEPRARPARAAITAVAAYVPDRILTNAELSQRLDTSDEWIVTRTGIRERRIGGPGETTSMMGAEAVRRLMEGLNPATSMHSSWRPSHRTCFSRPPPASFRIGWV